MVFEGFEAGVAMKDQYFGDENDYKKYGLLRMLADGGAMRIAVCWMLTDADQSTDGNKTDYLDRPGEWRSYDPTLFDWLEGRMKNRENRSVDWVRDAALIPHATYYDTLLTDDAGRRQVYFERFLPVAADCELVFYDPDTGLERKKPQYGVGKSSKYLYERELVQTYRAGHSVLVYQHFNRNKGVSRASFLQNEASRLRAWTGAAEIIAFRTSHTSFLLAPQPQHLVYLQERSEHIKDVWMPYITVVRHMERATL